MKCKGLILVRKPGESLCVTVDGVEVWVTVSATERGRAVLVVDAPPGVRVDREETKALRDARREPAACGPAPHPTADSEGGEPD